MAVALSEAVFLDRDGTLIADVGYPRDTALVRIIPGAVEAMHRLAAAGFALVVVSNQSGIGRGLVTQGEAAAVGERFAAEFAAAGVRFAGTYYCPHAPGDGCSCRKPEPGMLLDAARALGISLGGSFMVGDKASDAEAGWRAGCRAVLLNSPVEAVTDAAFVAGDWEEAVDFILDSKVPA